MKKLALVTLVGMLGAMAGLVACSSDDASVGSLPGAGGGASGSTGGASQGTGGTTQQTGGTVQGTGGGGQTVVACNGTFDAKHEVCEPMDAKGQGACFCLVGYAWNGITCTEITGCECVGDDCPHLFKDQQACKSAHTSCVGDGGLVVPCGSKFLAKHGKCDPMDAKGDGQCDCMIGYAWNGTKCDAITGCECIGADCWDLFTDLDACKADHASCSDAGK